MTNYYKWLKFSFILILVFFEVVIGGKIKAVYGAVEIESFPPEVQIDVENTLTLKGDMEVGTEYYLKVLIGESGKELDQGQTYNASSSLWLGYGNIWTSFPTVKMDSDGKIPAGTQIKFKVKSSGYIGPNNLKVRTRKVGSETNNDSNAVSVQVKPSSATPVATVTPSPVSASATPSPTASPTPTAIDKVWIVEVYPSPNTGEKEWVEFFNDHDYPVDLSGWYIQDARGGKKSLGSDFKIPSKTSAYLEFNSGFLNNEQDRVKLMIEETEKIVMPEAYPAIDKGYSWSQVNGTWCETNPSRGFGNHPCLSTEEADDSDEGEAETSTTPTAKPQILGAKTAAPSSPTLTKKKKEEVPDRDLPTLLPTEEPSSVASVAGISTISPIRKPNRLMIPLMIAGVGTALLAGAGYPLVHPRLVPLYSKLKFKK